MYEYFKQSSKKFRKAFRKEKKNTWGVPEETCENLSSNVLWQFWRNPNENPWSSKFHRKPCKGGISWGSLAEIVQGILKESSSCKNSSDISMNPDRIPGTISGDFLGGNCGEKKNKYMERNTF